MKHGKTRPSRVAPLPLEKVQEVLTLTMTGKPAYATHWSCRTMARQTGISRMAVHRMWSEHRLKPHQIKGFKVSTDPQFEAKLRDVVGLYMDPPEEAVVFSVDEKSQIQALDRTQAGLPLKPGKKRHDDARLQTPWHDHAVRRPGCPGGHDHRRLLAPPSPRRVSQVPQAHRPANR
ncbi:MAG: hypothetical protein PHY16_17420 [Methylobacter sp.]|nr:hypothetical protein [Methylobacter sp.]